MAAALRHAGAAAARARITFVATVGEEGAGDLRGAKHLFEDPSFRPDAFIAVDGAGADRVVHRALGSRRLRAVYRGPGGHSWAAFGVANPAHAVGLATAGIAGLPLPDRAALRRERRPDRRRQRPQHDPAGRLAGAGPAVGERERRSTGWSPA